MLQRTLNLGIVAHVDAGKTTLTERLLYEAGVIDAVGSVDAGTTQTDTLELERRRGITIRSAVTSFTVDDVHVNLIDTPGHPDFIAEVERVLSVLDGAVLVLSAVEGVQPQTRVLMRALQRLRVPTLLFVNKIDRAGAGEERILAAIAARLTPAVVALATTHELGTRGASAELLDGGDAGFRAALAELLAERDERVLAEYVDGGDVPYPRLRRALAEQAKRALVHPVFFGSALTGTGVRELTAGIAELLPASAGDPDGALAGTVFKIERGAADERVAYVRMFSGTLRVRDRVGFGADVEEKVTRIAVFDRGPAAQRPSVEAGSIAKLWGLHDVQVGDRIGEPGADGATRQFPPPTLEAAVAPADPGDRHRLRVALAQLAEQDPLINVRQDDRGELSVSLYGEVQQEVVQATLADDFGIDAVFHEATPLYVERVARAGEALEVLHAATNPYNATIGLRVEPAAEGSGIDVHVDVDPRTVPLYVYKTMESFREHMAQYVHDALREGLFGWEVGDCTVTMTECSYSVADGPPSRRGPTSTAADFRKLTPLVLVQALQAARTVVCEPMLQVRLEVPPDSIGAVMPELARLGASIETSTQEGSLARVGTVLPVTAARDLQRRLPGLTGGEGVLESEFAGYRPVLGEQPARRISA